jgi:dipeptidyl aminopeptidase/acylaminoacyl peptidase
VDGPVSDFKVAKLAKDDYAIALSAQAKPDGSINNPSKEEKPLSSGRLYKSLFVRHWDTWTSPKRNALWYGKLSRGDKTKYTLSSLVNALKGTGLESPIPPFGSVDHFDISSAGLAFVAKDPNLDPATNTRSNVYLVSPITYSASDSGKPYQIPIANFEGASTYPAFSPDCKQLAFLSMKENGYEADFNRLFVIPDLDKPFWVVQYLASPEDYRKWDRSPQSISWSPDSKNLYLTAQDGAQTRVFSLPSDPFSKNLPQRLLCDGNSEGR